MQLFQYKNDFVNQLKIPFGIEEAKSFFFMLCDSYLNMDKIAVALNSSHIISSTQLNKFELAKERLLNHEPIQHIIGHAYFYGNEFKVTPDTLIPRPETEELVDWIIQDIQNPDVNILDIGTGTGCIPVSLALELTKAKVSTMDISAEALKIAKINADNLNAQVNFIQQDVLKLDSFNQEYQIVVSNPPYVRESEKEQMHKNVVDFEPETALYVSDSDPLIFYLKIADLFLHQAHKKALLYFEINEYLSQELKDQLIEKGFTSVEIRQDFRGKDRMIKAHL